jgi:hypothetical protein
LQSELASRSWCFLELNAIHLGRIAQALNLRFNNGTEAAEAMKYRTTTVFFEKCAMSSVLFFSLCLQLAEVFVFFALKI